MQSKYVQPSLPGLAYLVNKLARGEGVTESNVMSSVEHVGEKLPQNVFEEIERSLASSLLRQGKALRGWNMAYQVNSWFMTLKVLDVDGNRLVAFIGGRSVTHVHKMMLKGVTSEELRWRLDKYQDKG